MPPHEDILLWHEPPICGGIPFRKWEVSLKAHVQSKLDAWYTDGRPMFPRETLEDIHSQFQDPMNVNGELIAVKGLDHWWYEFQLRTGDVVEYNGVPWRLDGPHIVYTPFERLMEHAADRKPAIYYTISIAYKMMHADQGPTLIGSVETAAKMVGDEGEAWGKTDSGKGITSKLSSLEVPPLKVTKIIGLACGTFMTVQNPKETKRSLVQHAFLIILRELVATDELGNGKPTCYVQDPAYIEDDRAVLTRMGIESLRDPAGFLEINESSIVFCCNPTTCVKSIIADIARPLILIWNTVSDDPHKESSSYWNPDCPRVRKMIEEEYDMFDFPEDENFGEMAIYVRKNALVPEE
ncbi:hypothetical protein BJY01DRAFT_250558 [Aspergillus pseudoustus]|uniref:SRR1-like domain-containing protein n=1 Tax=Aspergillus pseudoustus TaxID=1810923 RepID=A0ABR4JH65_9EURO